MYKIYKEISIDNVWYPLSVEYSDESPCTTPDGTGQLMQNHRVRMTVTRTR
jgi:hypothetical protein